MKTCGCARASDARQANLNAFQEYSASAIATVSEPRLISKCVCRNLILTPKEKLRFLTEHYEFLLKSDDSSQNTCEFPRKSDDSSQTFLRNS